MEKELKVATKFTVNKPGKSLVRFFVNNARFDVLVATKRGKHCTITVDCDKISVSNRLFKIISCEIVPTKGK